MIKDLTCNFTKIVLSNALRKKRGEDLISRVISKICRNITWHTDIFAGIFLYERKASSVLKVDQI